MLHDSPPTAPDQAPRVSILMAVYNGQDFLAEAVRSLLQQTFTDFELVVIDDGSTDSSPAILAGFAEQDPRVKITRHDNRGLTASLNAGLALCRGELIARMDGDDVCHPDRLARQVAAMDRRPDVVALGTGIRIIDAAGRVESTPSVQTEHDAIESRLWAGDGRAICHPVLMARSAALRDVHGYNERYRTAQDLDLYLRLGEVGRLANLPEPLLDYRQHTGSVNATKIEQQDRDVENMLRDALKRRDISPPRGWLQTRWNNRRRESLRCAAVGQRRDALRHAWRAARWRPVNLRSWVALALAFGGPRIARRYGRSRGLES